MNPSRDGPILRSAVERTWPQGENLRFVVDLIGEGVPAHLKLANKRVSGQIRPTAGQIRPASGQTRPASRRGVDLVGEGVPAHGELSDQLGILQGCLAHKKTRNPPRTPLGPQA